MSFSSSEVLAVLQLLQKFRAALATIRNLGDCPCPRCLIPISLAHNFGTPEDKQYRIHKARVDDSNRQTKVSKARKLIYGKIGRKKDTNFGVGSAAVERLLKDQSLVPTDVSCSVFKVESVSDYCGGYRMPFLTDWHHSSLICSLCLLLTSFMKLKLEFGGRFLFIC